MPVTLDIGGRRVQVDDAFRSMTPEQQQATVEEIVRSMGAQAQPSPTSAQGPTIQAGGRAIPVAEYMAMPPEERAAIQQQVGQANPSTSLQPAQSSVLDPFVQGATFGWGDEIRGVVQGAGAALQGGDFWDTYNRDTMQSRANLEHERSVNPWGSLAAEVVGAVPTSIVAGGGLAAQGAGLFGRAAMGAGVGLGQGAVYGAGSANPGERGQGALVGGAFGGAVGLATPLAATGVGAAYRNVANQMASRGAARQVGTTPQAADFLAERLAADDALSPQGLARMRAAGGEAMLADAGPSAVNALDFAIQSSGGAGRVAREAIGQRVSRESAALQNALDRALGQPTGAQSLRAGIRDSTAGARRQAYDAAYAQPIDYSSPEGRQLEELLGRLSQSDIERANALMRMEGHQSNQILADIAEDGTVTYFRQPDVRQIDYITRALNDRAQANAGLGALGGQTNEGRIFGQLAGELRDVLRFVVPEYDVALNTAADPIRRSQAVEFGTTLLTRNVPRDEVANAVLSMTGPERAAAMQGVRSYIDDMLANVTRTVSDGDMPAREAISALRTLSSRANREKLTALLGADRAGPLLAEIDRITRSFELRAGVADNSKTFMRQNMNRALDEMTEPDGPLARLMRGEPMQAGRAAIQAVTGATPARSRAQREAILEEVARMLTDRTGQAVSTMQALRFLTGAQGANSAVAQGITHGGQAGLSAAAMPTVSRF